MRKIIYAISLLALIASPTLAKKHHTATAQIKTAAQVEKAKKTKHSREERIRQLEATVEELKSRCDAHDEMRKQNPTCAKVVATSDSDKPVQLIIAPMLQIMGDFDAPQTDLLTASKMSLKGLSSNRSPGAFHMSPAGTILGFKTRNETTAGLVRSHVEIDFYGDPDKSTPRLRHAYITWCRFLAGQTNTLFHDLDSQGRVIDINGSLGGTLRQAQLRISHKCDCGLDMAASLERPFADSVSRGVDSNNVLNDRSFTDETSTTTGFSMRGKYSQPALPDGVLAFKYVMPRGHVGLRFVLRDIRLKYNPTETPSGSDYRARSVGRGIGLSARVYVYNKTNVFAQVNHGRGMGRYIPDATGYSAFIDQNNKRFELLRASNYLIGTEFVWTDTVKSNVIYNSTRIGKSKHMQSEVKDFNKKIEHVFVNTFVEAAKNFEVGAEYDYTRRETHAGYKANGHRVQAMVLYRF